MKATISTPVTSIKNPIKGTVSCKSVGELIVDENSKAKPGEFVLETED